MKIEICFSPLLYPAYRQHTENTIVVVVDVFRASTTMCMALQNGASGIIPVSSLEEAERYKEKGYLVGGERNVKKFGFADFGNSPEEYTPEKVKGKVIVISTTNGTHAIATAKDAGCLLVGSFSNLHTVAGYCSSQDKDVLVVCSGWENKFNIEDSLFGGAMVEILKEKGFDTAFDSSQAALSLWMEAKGNPWQYIQRSEHIKRLEAHGLLEVGKFCLQTGTSRVLPVYDKTTKIITNGL